MNNRVKELRLARELTQTELADALGVSRQTIHSIESGKYDPSLPLAFKISRLLGAAIEEVFSPEP